MIKKELGLEFNDKKFREATLQALDHITRYFEKIEDLPMKDLKGIEKFKKVIREPLPKRGTSLEKLLKVIFKELLPKGIQVPSPGYLAYVPVGTVYPSVIAEFVSFAINRWVGLYQYSPGFIEIENTVLRWLCHVMGLPKESGGILTSGGSLANLSAIVAARHTVLGEEFHNGCLYYSELAHHSVEKSARIVGIAGKNLRPIPTNEKFELSISHLKTAILEDQKKGLSPFLVVGTAGTTGTGSIDDLVSISEICKEHGLWFHVDAAWAGSLRLTRKGPALFKGTELADSITIDPHKAFYTPFGCGALLVKDPKKLKEAHSFEAAYLPGEDDEESLMSPSKLSPELSRGLRGLQVWLPLKAMGIESFRKTFEEKLMLTKWLTRELKKIKEIQIVFEPPTPIVGFRLFDRSKSKEELNHLNQKLIEMINSDGRILLSGITLKGDFTIRVIPFGQNTHFKQVKIALELIKSSIEEIR